MPVSVLLRAAASVLLGAGAAVYAWIQVGTVNPRLEIEAKRAMGTSLWELRVTARGGETIGKIRVDSQSPRLRLVGDATYEGLRSGWTKVFHLEFDASDGSTARVYVSQEGPVSATYDIPIGGQR